MSLLTIEVIDRWKIDVAEVYEEIQGWRDAVDRREWTPPPKHLYADTHYLIAEIAGRHSDLKLSPQSIIETLVTIENWYADQTAHQVPERAKLRTIVENAMLTVNAVQAAEIHQHKATAPTKMNRVVRKRKRSPAIAKRNEAIKQMFKGGKSIDEVCAAFPKLTAANIRQIKSAFVKNCEL